MSREPKIPNADHPINVSALGRRVLVRAGATSIADSQAALVMHEANYPPVYYIPLADVDQALLRPSDTKSYCPYKGDASYASVNAGDRVIDDALWFYPDPYQAVSVIKDHVAFYGDRVEIVVEDVQDGKATLAAVSPRVIAS